MKDPHLLIMVGEETYEVPTRLSDSEFVKPIFSLTGKQEEHNAGYLRKVVLERAEQAKKQRRVL